MVWDDTLAAGSVLGPGSGQYDKINELIQAVKRRGAKYVVTTDAYGDYTCDGTADNVQIQQAIDNLTSGRTYCEVIQLRGSFTVATKIVLKGFVVLDLTNARLTLANSVNDCILSINHPASAAHEYTYVLNGVLNGNSANQSTGGGIYVEGGANTDSVHIVGTRIEDCKDYGLELHQIGGMNHVVDVDIVDSASIGLKVDGTNDSFFRGVDIGRCGDEGAYFVNSADANKISDCNFWENTKNGLSLNGINSLQVENCRSDNNLRNGIYILDSYNVTVNNCLCYDNSHGAAGTYHGINIDGGGQHIITNNRCLDFQATREQEYGILEANTTDYNVIQGNNCYINRTGPYVVLGAHDCFDGLARTAVSADLSAAPTPLVALHAEQRLWLARATLLYTAGTGAGNTTTVKIGKESDNDYYYTGTTEESKGQWYSKTVTLLKKDVAAGDTVLFTWVQNAGNTGEIMVILDWLGGA